MSEKQAQKETKQDSSPTFYGNKDSDKTTPLPADWKDSVVVEQWSVDNLNGGMVEVPNTRRVQTYSKEFFAQLIDDKKKKNFFAESGMKYNVLHMPA